jgi:hypothetical protein
VDMQPRLERDGAMILLRTHIVDARLAAFAEELERLSWLPVVYLVDERNGVADVGGRDKIGLTLAACEAMGLYCPDDFAWRCGDYGFYLARRSFPRARHIWLIENDVRIAGTDPAAFFAKFAGRGGDLIAGYIGDSEPDWPWRATTESCDAIPKKCFFPVVRLSAEAIDTLLAKRRAHARSWCRRILWPNDEAFVATTLIAAGADTLDLNAGEPSVYRREQFSFDTIRDGDLPLDSDARVALFHPVLSGDALRRKYARLAQRLRAQQRCRLARLAKRLQRAVGPQAFARQINRRAPW